MLDLSEASNVKSALVVADIQLLASELGAVEREYPQHEATRSSSDRFFEVMGLWSPNPSPNPNPNPNPKPDPNPNPNQVGARVALRLGAASGCCLVVLCVPNLSSLIDLVGAVANTALASLPCLLHAALLLRTPP